MHFLHRRTDADRASGCLGVCVVAGLTAHAVYMPFSAGLFDLDLDAVHLLKIVSYVFVLIGLAGSMYQVFRAAEEGHVRTRALVDHAVDGIITIDDKGIVESLNPNSIAASTYSSCLRAIISLRSRPPSCIAPIIPNVKVIQ